MSRMRMKWRWVPVVLVACVITAWGRVYTRTPGGGPARLTAEGLGWASAHRASLVVNGAATDVEVLHSDRDLRGTMQKLEHLYREEGAEVLFDGESAMGWGLAVLGNRLIKVLAIAPEHESSVLVFRTEQATGRKPAARREPLADMPAFPGAVSSYTASNEASGLDTQTYRASASGRDVLGFFHTELVSAGWAPALPAGASTALYVRNGEACCVSVNSAGPGSDTRFTVVRKNLGLGTE